MFRFKDTFANVMRSQVAMLVMLAVSSTVWAQTVKRSTTVVDLPTQQGTILKDGYIYKVKAPDTRIGSASSQGAALDVEQNATVTIYIPSGNSLILQGGDGNYQQEGYPSIHVPENSTLIITGEGTLIATGGKVGQGGSGQKGGNGYKDGKNMVTGNGGTSGAGGGGGAPAIGGTSGRGANSVAGGQGSSRSRDYSNYDCNGTDGKSAVDGENGTGMGKVYILGTVKVTATAGGTSGIYVASYDKTWASGASYSQGFLDCYTYTADGGGPGAGGGSGFVANYGIGGGAPGGQCGGSGGSGGHMSRTWATTWIHGGGGEPGHGAVTAEKTDVATGSAYNKSAGAGGKAADSKASWGGDGSLYVGDRVNLTMSQASNVAAREIKTATSNSAIEFTISFADEEHSTTCPQVVACYGMKPKSVTPPTYGTDFFMGYYTDGNVQIYDANGNALEAWTYAKDMTLQAHWSTMRISTAKQLQTFCTNVNSMTDTQKIEAYLEADIDVSDFSTNCTIGTKDNPFKGKIDGQFHTLKVRKTLFQYVSGATISNLIVTGTATDAGLIDQTTDPNTTTTLNNVEVRTSLTSTKYRAAGIAYVTNGRLTLNNCSFTGSMSGNSGTAWYGICAEPTYKLTLNHCLVALSDDSNISGTFNALAYSTNLNVVAGQSSCLALARSNINYNGATAIESRAKLESGEVCYRLNGNNTNGAWFQSIGEDNAPTICHTSRKVFLDNGKYHNRNCIKLNNDAGFCTRYVPNEKTEVDVDFNTYDIRNETSVLFASLEEGGAFCSMMFRDSTLLSSCGGSDARMTPVLNPYSAYTLYMGRGKYYLDNLPYTGAKHVWEYSENAPKSFTESDSLYVLGNNYYYGFIVMEEGRLVHNFLPSNYNGKPGFYDTVKGEFVQANSNAEVYIDKSDCKHTYTTKERQSGKVYDHCNICDECFNYTYYSNVVFEKNEDTPKSEVEAYNKVAGSMGVQTIDASDTLCTELYTRPMHIFWGWNSKKDGTGMNYLDNSVFTCTEQTCDTVHLYAQWQPAYQYNGKHMDVIPTDGAPVEEMNLVDDGTNGFAAAKPFTVKNASYTFTPAEGTVWGTVCLPFAFNAKQLDGVTFYTDGTVRADSTIVLSTPAETVGAGVAAIYHLSAPATGESKIITANNVTIVTTPQTPANQNLRLQGSFEYKGFKCTDLDDTMYFGIMHDKFYYVESSIVLRPYHAYFYKRMSDENALSRTTYDIELSGETGIESVSSSSTMDSSDTWDLTGRKVSGAGRHGIYIINGNKVIR